MTPSSSRNRGVAERIHANPHSVDDPPRLATGHHLAKHETVCRYMSIHAFTLDQRIRRLRSTS
jgi:hypothetical protein